MIRVAVIVLGVLLSFGANAQTLRLKNYLHPENDRLRIFNEIYLAGAVDALTAYNVAAPVKVFCKEGGLVSHEEAAHLLSEWAEKQTNSQDDTIIVMPLLLLLKKTYPCH
jgi:hypothetical protein